MRDSKIIATTEKYKLIEITTFQSRQLFEIHEATRKPTGDLTWEVLAYFEDRTEAYKRYTELTKAKRK